MDLPLDTKLRIGIQTIHRRTEPAVGPWLPTIDEMHALVSQIDRCGYDSIWVADHVWYPAAILDPLLQLAQAAVVSRRLLLGIGVYLLPLRHPVPVAKQVATLDHLSEGRLIFGVGIGGEFAREYEACGVPVNERGPRLSEGITLLRRLMSGAPRISIASPPKFYRSSATCAPGDAIADADGVNAAKPRPANRWKFRIFLSIFHCEIYNERAMAISLKDPETDRLARAVAALTGETLTTAIRKALAERLERERLRRGEIVDLVARLREIGEHCASLPVLDPRSPDEIVGYDETGMWT